MNISFRCLRPFFFLLLLLSAIGGYAQTMVGIRMGTGFTNDLRYGVASYTTLPEIGIPILIRVGENVQLESGLYYQFMFSINGAGSVPDTAVDAKKWQDHGVSLPIGARWTFGSFFLSVGTGVDYIFKQTYRDDESNINPVTNQGKTFVFVQGGAGWLPKVGKRTYLLVQAIYKYSWRVDSDFMFRGLGLSINTGISFDLGPVEQ